MAHNVDPILKDILLGSEAPAGDLRGTGSDDALDPVGRLIFETQYKIPVPSAAAVRKTPSIAEIENTLYAMRKSRRATFVGQNAEFLKDARATIRSFCREHSDEIVAAGSFEKICAAD